MIKKLHIFLLFSFSISCLHSQTNDTNSLATTTINNSTFNSSPKSETFKSYTFNPTIGLGTGMFSFYGDINTKKFQAPMVSRVAFELNIAQRFTDYLQFNFYLLNGKLGANERGGNANRNLNFQSQIRAGGINILYNFDNFLPQKRDASPYISLGFESFEFLSKTDLYDVNGDKYYYWSDNTIRNKSETDPNAFSAIEIKRDYNYESDIRELNIDNFGKYPERSFAMPIGVGSIFKINNYIDAKIGITMHFAFTDYIDGVTHKSLNNRIGNSKNDNFMMSSFSLHYNFGIDKKKKFNEEEQYKMNEVDYFALDKDDQDLDGVTDLMDSCQGTPAGVPVDARGCPFDDDIDGVPSFEDNELNSGINAFVDEKGVTITDSVLTYRYEFYMDSTGRFAKVEVHDHKGNIVINPFTQKIYTVALGTYKKGISPALLTQFLSINDINSINNKDSTTTYTAGSFTTLAAAEQRKQELLTSGIAEAKVVYKQKGEIYNVTDVSNTINQQGNSSNNSNNANNTSTPSDVINLDTATSGGIVFRIQLGAYHKPISKVVFKNISNLIEIKTDDSLFKYMTGAYANINTAAKNKVEVLLKGYDGAFITAYKNGKRIPLKEAGATTTSDNNVIEEISDHTAISGVNKKLVIFKVQIGALIFEPTPEAKLKFAKIKNLEKESTSKGLNRYVVGAFNDYNIALKTKNNLVADGVTDAFIIAFFNGEQITTQEAIELLR